MEPPSKMVSNVQCAAWPDDDDDDDGRQGCVFCNREALDGVVYQDADVIAFQDIRPAGRVHWLIAPIEHLRDIERLSRDHVQLLEKMDAVKSFLLERQCAGVPRAAIHAGFHRGRRPFWGAVWWPDIISVPHLHLHVIVEPRPLLRWFKYPSWLSLLWLSDTETMRQVRRRSGTITQGRGG